MSTWGGHRIDHVGIAVHDLDAALLLYGALARDRPVHRETVPHDGVEVAFLQLPGASLELLASRRDDSAVANFLARRGEGLHHLALAVPDIGAELDRWRGLGAELIDKAPRAGSRGMLVAFIHPRSAHGVLVELCQRS